MKKIDKYFLFVVCIFILPIVLYYVLLQNLGRVAEKGIIENIFFDKNKKISIPHDHSRDSEVYNEYHYQGYVDTSKFIYQSNHGIIFGRVGDRLKVRLNDCLIHNEPKSRKWLWGYYRSMYIPERCIDYNKLSQSISADVFVDGFANKGVFRGPVAVIEFSEVNSLINAVDFFRFGIFFLFGVLLIIGIFTYYFFVWLLIPERKQYFYFSLFAFFSGLYLTAISGYPYRYVSGKFGIIFNLFSSIFAGYFLIKFYNYKYKTVSDKYSYLYLGSLLLVVVALFRTMNGAYQFFQVYYLIFIIATSLYAFLFTVQVIRKKLWNEWRYLFGIIVLLLTFYSDIYSALTHSVDFLFFPYGFMILLVTVSLSLAKESADAFIYVEAQVEDRTLDLSRANDKLKALEKMKERLFANISHDLKTPITIALGAIEDVKSKYATTIGQALAPADRALYKLKRMVSSILMSIKSDAHGARFHMVPTSVEVFLKDKLDEIGLICQKHGIITSMQGQGEAFLKVPMDIDIMSRVLDNLLSNAIKYTQNTDKNIKVIRIRYHSDDVHVHMYVDDSGIGVPVDERDKIFKRFVQSSNTDIKEHGGTGIGLSFVKDSIEAHHGSVSMKESQWGGSSVHITMPLRQNLDMVSDGRSSLENSLKGIRSELSEGTMNVPYPPSKPDDYDSSKSHMLSCEDRPEVAQIIYNTFKDECNFYFASNGVEGLKLLKQIKMDLILTDIQMPRMDGHALTTEVRKLSTYDLVPIIFYTSLDQPMDIVKGLNMGGQGYIGKPAHRDLLKAIVSKELHQSLNYKRMLSSEKLAMTGHLANSIAHEANQPLGTVLNASSYLTKFSKHLPDADSIEGDTHTVTLSKHDLKVFKHSVTKLPVATHKVISLIKAMNTHASGSKNKTELHLDALIQSALDLIEGKRKAKGDIFIAVTGDKGIKLQGYAALQSVISNLLSNALDAVEDRPRPKIVLNVEDQLSTVLIRVKDNGMGISPAVIDTIFDAYVTTKDAQSGTGLGLYSSRMIIENMFNGQISVRSKLGEMTEFIVEIPKNAPELEHISKEFHGFSHL